MIPKKTSRKKRTMYSVQAEDGIRDSSVTGVQTCALPICVVNFRRTELLRQVMLEYGDAGKPIMITEGGWNDHPRWTRAVKPAQRIQYTIQAYELARGWEWCQAVALW